ncbi:MAG TPA: RodZ domain-containing protein [Solirubrobacterales bacterium]|nr:RodZ domain-containing protein [Solirubrobacterales bacterium]
MAPGIGTTLRETRNRLRIDLGQVEAETKIRIRYLRAIENEEWDVLPGGAYTRSFIRTYANHLGLDGERLADDFRRAVEAPPGAPSRPEPPRISERRTAGGPRLPAGVVAGLIGLVLIGVLVAIGLSGSDEDGSEPAGGGNRPSKEQKPGQKPSQRRVELRLTASAPVWVCVLDASGREVVDGQTLSTGQEAGPFRSAGFRVAFGNGAIEMELNGEPAATDQSPNPVGYRIGRRAGLALLPEGNRPECG